MCLPAHHRFSRVCRSGVSGTCMKITKVGQLYLREEKSRVLHLSSLYATTERSASAPLTSAAMSGRFTIQPWSVCMHFSFHFISLPVRSKFLSTAPTNTRDTTNTQRHLDRDTLPTKQRILITSNGPCSFLTKLWWCYSTLLCYLITIREIIQALCQCDHKLLLSI